MQEMNDSTIQPGSAGNRDTVPPQHSAAFREDDGSGVRNKLRETQASVNSVSPSLSCKRKCSKFLNDEGLKAV